MDIEKFPGIKKNIKLAPFTTFKIGGEAKYFLVAKTKEDLIKAIRVAKKLKLPFFILGGGSNILVADEGFEGLVINFQFPILNFQKDKIIAGAGLILGKLVNIAIERGLTGLEWTVGIPGTVGGAIYGNAGAFGESMSDIVEEVEIFDIGSEKIKNLKNKNCRFDYRDSIFKKNKNLIIFSAILKLKKGKKSEIKKKMAEFLEYRKKTQPLNFPSAGSVFKNPQGFSAGELIEKCGLKGKRIGNAQISKKHANFIVNLGDASAQDVKRLIELIKQKVKQKFGIQLEKEIQYLGF